MLETERLQPGLYLHLIRYRKYQLEAEAFFANMIIIFRSFL